MTALPTCWYCPECDKAVEREALSGHKDGNHYHWFEHHPSRRNLYCEPACVRVPMIPPGTPLPVILDALGIEYHESQEAVYPDGDIGRFPSNKLVLVVDNPAPVEARKIAPFYGDQFEYNQADDPANDEARDG